MVVCEIFDVVWNSDVILNYMILGIQYVILCIFLKRKVL